MQKFILRNRSLSNSSSTMQLNVGGKSEIHGVELNERKVWMQLSDRVGHTLVLGTTGVGKTRLAELLITQDIRRGDVVIVFDPKGDGRASSSYVCREQEVRPRQRFSVLSPRLSLDIDPLQCHRTIFSSD